MPATTLRRLRVPPKSPPAGPPQNPPSMLCSGVCVCPVCACWFLHGGSLSPALALTSFLLSQLVGRLEFQRPMASGPAVNSISGEAGQANSPLLIGARHRIQRTVPAPWLCHFLCALIKGNFWFCGLALQAVVVCGGYVADVIAVVFGRMILCLCCSCCCCCCCCCVIALVEGLCCCCCSCSVLSWYFFLLLCHLSILVVMVLCCCCCCSCCCYIWYWWYIFIVVVVVVVLVLYRLSPLLALRPTCSACSRRTSKCWSDCSPESCTLWRQMQGSSQTGVAVLKLKNWSVGIVPLHSGQSFCLWNEGKYFLCLHFKPIYHPCLESVNFAVQHCNTVRFYFNNDFLLRGISKKLFLQFIQLQHALFPGSKYVCSLS